MLQLVGKALESNGIPFFRLDGTISQAVGSNDHSCVTISFSYSYSHHTALLCHHLPVQVF